MTQTLKFSWLPTGIKSSRKWLNIFQTASFKIKQFTNLKGAMSQHQIQFHINKKKLFIFLPRQHQSDRKAAIKFLKNVFERFPILIFQLFISLQSSLRFKYGLTKYHRSMF